MGRMSQLSLFGPPPADAAPPDFDPGFAPRTELLEAEAALRELLPVRELRPYVRPLAQLLEELVRRLRARAIAFARPAAGALPLWRVGAVVDGAYVAARAPSAAPATSALRVAPGPARAGSPCAVGVDLDAAAATVARFDVELVDRTGARVALGRAAPEPRAARAAASIALGPLEAAGEHRLVASALLASGEVVVTIVVLTVAATDDVDVLDPPGLPAPRTSGLTDRLDREVERAVAGPARRFADELRRAEADPAFARERAERSEVELRRELDRVEAELEGRPAPLRPRR